MKNLGKLLEQFIEDSSYSYSTECTLRSILADHIAFLGGSERAADTVTRDEILAWKTKMTDRTTLFINHPKLKPRAGTLSPWTIYRNLKNARIFWTWAVKWEKGLTSSPFDGVRVKKPRRVSASEKAAPFETLLALLPVARRALRDWAMYLFLLDTGCRRSGLCSLKLGGLDLDNCTAVLTEKGDKRHVVAFSDHTAQALRAWLAVRPQVKDEEVFLSFSNCRLHKPITPDGVATWLKLMCEEASAPVIGPHAIRHSVGIHLAMSGEPLSLLRELLGHSSSQITMEFYMPDNLVEVRNMVCRNGLAGALLDVLIW